MKRFIVGALASLLVTATAAFAFDLFTDLNMHGNGIANVGAPAADGDAATKSYVDAEVAGVEAGITSSWPDITDFPADCGDDTFMYGVSGATNKCRTITVDGVCFGVSGGHLYQDTDCNGAKNSGERFLDKVVHADRDLNASLFNNVTLVFPGFVPSAVDLSVNVPTMRICAALFYYHCPATYEGDFCLSGTGNQTVTFAVAPPICTRATMGYDEAE